jgi:hypothetical protein
MQGRFGHMYPEHVAKMQLAANRNWEDLGVEVPAKLRELEDPTHNEYLKEVNYSLPVQRGVGA